MLIQWIDAMSVGDQSIDAQHRQLIDTINKLDEAMRVGRGQDALLVVFDRLIRYVKTHFAHEEALMERIGFPNIDAHRLEHRALTTKVVEFRQKLTSGQIGLAIPVSTFLQKWLENHIMVSDRAYAPFLKKRAA